MMFFLLSFYQRLDYVKPPIVVWYDGYGEYYYVQSGNPIDIWWWTGRRYPLYRLAYFVISVRVYATRYTLVG